MLNIDNGNGSFLGHQDVSRCVQFQRYRTPCFYMAPRNAVLLNKRRTNELHCGIAVRSENKSDGETSSLAFGDDDREDEVVDDDDPMDIDPDTMLCSDEQLQRVLAFRWREIGPHGCGLQNLGNTCFVNSVLQAIAYTPALSQYFSSGFRTPHTDRAVSAPFDYAYALGETVRRIHTPSKNAYRPTVIVSNMKVLSPHFRLGFQGDAHEFVVHLLHACHRSILYRQVGSRKLPQHIEQTSTLQRIVGGYLRSTVTWSRQEEIRCLLKEGKMQEADDLRMNVGARMSMGGKNPNELISNVYDPFVTLSPEISGHTLEHCLSKLCSKERLEGRVYITPRGVAVNATKQFMLHKLPNILIIHLKRFDGLGVKVGKYVRYPKILDVAPFCTGDGTLKLLSKDKLKRRKACGDANGSALDNGVVECLYELNAICVHQGGSLSRGHYYSVVRARNGTWIECNDDRISHCSEDRALSQPAYMLFYSRMEERHSCTPDARGDQRNQTTPRGSGLQINRLKPLAATVPPTTVGNRGVMDVGRELTEEEASCLMGERRGVPQLPLGENSSESKSGYIGLPTRMKGPNTNTPVATAREVRSGYPLRREHKEMCSSSSVSSLSTDTERNESPVSREKNMAEKDCEIAKVMGAAGSRNAGAVRSPAAISVPNERDVVVGKDVVAAMERQSMAGPPTVKRQSQAPKFRQQVRDPSWELEMDRGRVKRLRMKGNDGDDGENKFQRADVRFDSRGRRVTEDRSEMSNGRRSMGQRKFP